MQAYEAFIEAAEAKAAARLFHIARRFTRRWNMRRTTPCSLGLKRATAAESARQSAEEHRLRLPLLPGNRSLNLSNVVAVAV
jgi:tRNA(Leu) C34 or U34 (ribose-2'-O)-methylase TrmL